MLSPAFDPYRSNTVLNEICSRVSEDLEGLFDRLGVRFYRDGRRYTGPCPVHGGSRYNSCSVYSDGYDAKGMWYCFSEHCETFFKRSVLGFTRGVLSHNAHQWTPRKDVKIPFRKAVDFLLEMLGIKIGDIKYDPLQEEQHRFEVGMQYLSPTRLAHKGLCDRKEFRKYVKIPSQYFIDRGFTPQVLDRYDVGLCTNKNSGLFGRVAVPVYDEDHERVLGVVGRATCDKCPDCHTFHGGYSQTPLSEGTPCPSPDERKFYSKWRCAEGFVDKDYLYNYWTAQEAITRTRSVIMVEGPGDVWRCVEAGIENVVGLFGNKLTDTQQVTLEHCNIHNFIIALDSDEGGTTGAGGLARQIGHLGRVIRVVPKGDVGGMDVADVRTLLGGWS